MLARRMISTRHSLPRFIFQPERLLLEGIKHLMALTGHLSDLSLSELIEFFCNQRKSGRLKVLYPQGAGYFYLQAGSVVDARIGVLRGIDAVYFALTLPNAEFEFSADAESLERTINQPWTQVVLEGLRRLDENISPGVAFPPNYVHDSDELETPTVPEPTPEAHKSFAPQLFGFATSESKGGRKPFFVGAIVVAVIGSVAAIGVPAGWYHRKPAPPEVVTQPEPTTTEPEVATEDAAAAAKRQRERDKKARDARAVENAGNLAPAPAPETKPGAKRVVVTVTYDESGRVTQASGGDANALRIARQKRFPPGKAGSATVAIPIN
ncbi:MAG: hypothetical protein DMF69_03715 [Acidobacteria bacterium]|nr:MAG: hypothetical protein DMF69_03715 [Acidobacteriota bacterium]